MKGGGVIKIEPASTGKAAVAAGAAGVVPWLEAMSLAIFGVPMAVWVAGFAGSVFAVTFVPQDSGMSKPISIGMNTIGAVYLTGAATANFQFANSAPAGAAFVIGFVLIVALKPIVETLRRVPGELWDRIRGKERQQ